MTLELRNPHSILAALQARPQAVGEVRLYGGRPRGAWKEVATAAEGCGVRLLRGAPKRPEAGRTGAGEARVQERAGVDLDSLFAARRERSAEAGLWLALDRLQDPHNVGAVFRTAAFFGVEGIVLTRDRSCPLNATVYDVAAGGLECVPFSQQANLARALEKAKQAGLWVMGASEHATEDVRRYGADRPWLLVVGNEEKGLRRLTREKCDVLCRLSPRGPVGSLNVSVATGILVASLTPRS